MVKVTVDMIRERTGMSIREFIARGATDFKFWVEALFPYRLKWFHVEWAKLYYNNKRVCIIAHRSSGKSTVLAVLFHLWMGFYEENKNFMIVSHNMSLSSRHIREMRRLIKDVELLHVLYPPDRGYSWTKTEIHLATGCKIFCKPYSENMLGYEALHFCLIDEASCLKDLSIYERTLLPMLAHHDGHLCIIGTPKTDTDLLARAQLPNSGFVVKKYPAIIEGKPLWPEKFPMSKLERIRKEMGEIAFAREYLLELRSEAAQAIPNEVIIKCMDPEYRFENEGEAGGEYYIGADLAMSPQGDYSVFVVLKRIGDKLLISRIERYKGMDFGTQLQYLASLWQRFKPVKMLVDESVFGSAVVEELRNKYGVPALGFKFTPQNRNAILGQLINAMKDQKIVIPRHKDCPYTLNLTDKLVHELTGLYPDKTKTGLDTYKTVTKHDDCVMALALALQAASSITVPKELIVVKF